MAIDAVHELLHHVDSIVKGHERACMLDIQCNVLTVRVCADEEMWSELHHEAVEIQEQMIGRNKVAILNLVSDSTSALSLFGILVQVRPYVESECHAH